MQIDAAGYRSDDGDLSNAAEVRRAWLYVKGKAADAWFYRFEYNLTGTGSDGLQDFYIGYAGPEPVTRLYLGQLREAGSLEDTSSARCTTFMERALPVLAFNPAERRLGARAETHGAGWYATAGVFGDSAAADETADEGLGASARLACAPRHAPGRVLHAGLFGAYRSLRADTLRVRARPECHVDDTRLVDTGAMTNAAAYALAGLEAAAVFGPLSVQGEYLAMAVDREHDGTPHFSGWYAFASWFLTGESRVYDAAAGKFECPRPSRALGEGGAGAWELGVRYSTLDLDDDVRGGTEDNVTVGLNWYANRYVRFTANYVRAHVSRNDADVDADIGMVRAQLEF
jgi:phosphate-selective porin OprO/OprP